MTTTTDRPRPRPAHGPRSPYRLATWLGAGLVVALLLAIVVVARGFGDDASSRAELGPVRAPDNLSSSGWVSLGRGPVTVAIYFDYLCPACGAFEAANGAELERLLDSGDITVELRPIAFLDHLSAGTEYSTRAANALATVVDQDPGRAWAFHRALYAHQPAEGGEGLTDDELAALARDAGVPEPVTQGFADRRFEAWIAERTEHAFAAGVQGTPTILVDGHEFGGDPFTTGPLTAAIAQSAP